MLTNDADSFYIGGGMLIGGEAFTRAEFEGLKQLTRESADLCVIHFLIVGSGGRGGDLTGGSAGDALTDSISIAIGAYPVVVGRSGEASSFHGHVAKGGADGRGQPIGDQGWDGVVIVRYATGSMEAIGGTVTAEGPDTIHTFTSSATFIRVL